jgi:hypothetical protein
MMEREAALRMKLVQIRPNFRWSAIVPSSRVSFSAAEVAGFSRPSSILVSSVSALAAASFLAPPPSSEINTSGDSATAQVTGLRAEIA